MTTLKVDDPLEIRRLYHLRSSCEEGWRQTKCYWDLTAFRSPRFSLVVSQIVFVLLAYSLLQLFLVKSARGELAKTRRRRDGSWRSSFPTARRSPSTAAAMSPTSPSWSSRRSS